MARTLGIALVITASIGAVRASARAARRRPSRSRDRSMRVSGQRGPRDQTDPMTQATGGDPHAGSAPAGVRQFHAQGTGPGAPGGPRGDRDLRLAPVMFELGARPHPPRDLYRAYLEQSDVFVGLYAERYGWVAPGEEISGLEDEYRLAPPQMPKLVYIKERAVQRGAAQGASRPDQGRRRRVLHVLHRPRRARRARLRRPGHAARRAVRLRCGRPAPARGSGQRGGRAAICAHSTRRPPERARCGSRPPRGRRSSGHIDGVGRDRQEPARALGWCPAARPLS